MSSPLVPTSDRGGQVAGKRAPRNAEIGKLLREDIQTAIRPFSWFVGHHARHEFQNLQRNLLPNRFQICLDVLSKSLKFAALRAAGSHLRRMC